MNIKYIEAVLDNDKPKAYALSLAKGGYEGWLQAELWYYISVFDKKTVEREIAYPNGNICDLYFGTVGTDVEYVELKACGDLRSDTGFFNAVDVDLKKLKTRPDGSAGSLYVVVSHAHSDVARTELKLSGQFQEQSLDHFTIFYCQLPKKV